MAEVNRGLLLTKNFQYWMDAAGEHYKACPTANERHTLKKRRG